MGGRNGGRAVSVLRLAIIGIGMLGQREGLGAEIALPPQFAAIDTDIRGASSPLYQTAQLDTGTDPSAGVSESGSLLEPQPSPGEVNSIVSFPSSTQKRRRPKMVGVPESRTPVLMPEEEPEVRRAEGEEKPASPGMEEGVVVQKEESAQPAQSPGELAQLRAKQSQGIGRKYSLAPIRWQGYVFEQIGRREERHWGKSETTIFGRRYTLKSGGQGLINSYGAGIRANSYILYPWVAAVRGNLGIVVQDARYKYGRSGHDNQVFGGVGLNLFQYSRYPFLMQYDVTNGRGDTLLSETESSKDIISKRLELLQKYRPLRGPERYDIGYTYNSTSYLNNSVNASLISSASSGTTIYTNLSAHYGTRLGEKQDQPLNASFGHNTSEQTSLKYVATRDTLMVNHLYRPEDILLTMRTNGTYFQARDGAGITRSFNVGSLATWQPEELDNPLIVRGGLKFYRTQNEKNGLSSYAQVLNTNVEATYPKWQYVTLIGGGTLTGSLTNGRSSLVTSQYGRTTYRPPQTLLREDIRYRKWVEAGFQNIFSNGRTASNLLTYAGANHSLTSKATRYKVMGSSLSLTGSVKQSLYVRTNRLDGSSETLSNTASLSWVPLGLRASLPSAGAAFNKASVGTGGSTSLITNVNLTARDIRRFGTSPYHTQIFEINTGAGAGAGYLARAAGYGGSANLRLRYVRTTHGSRGGLVGDAAWGYKFNYDFKYKKIKVFDVEGLNYKLDFNVNIDPEVRKRRQLVFNTSEQTSSSTDYVMFGAKLEQTLSYRIGLNEALLSAMVQDQYGMNTASLFLRFRAWRIFGN